MIELRPFQADLVNATRAELRRSRSVLLQAPCGAGKTVMSAAMISSAIQKQGRPWFVVHRDFLIEQTSKTLDRFGIEHGFIAAGRPFNPWHRAQVCSAQTLATRLERVPASCRPTVLFIDEGHHAAAGTWARIIRHFSDAKVVGLTATPARLDGKPLSEHYGAMIPGPSVAWLIEQGYLSDYRAFAPSTPDLGGVSDRAGDYATDGLDKVMSSNVLVGDAVKHFQRLAAGKRAIYYAVSIHHSQLLTAAFVAGGIRAVHLDGTSPTFERVRAAKMMARGQLDVIVNVDLFGEGFDLAAQAGEDVTIDVVGLCRPTKSLTMYTQQVMRCFRPKPYPATVIDHAGNLAAHGLPDEDRVWSLEGRKKSKKGDAPAVPSPRTCLACFASFRPTLPKCPVCSEPVPVQQKVPDVEDGELHEVDRAALKRERQQQEHAAKSVEDLIRVGRARGYRDPEGWAAHLWTVRERGKQRVAEERARQYRMGV